LSHFFIFSVDGLVSLGSFGKHLNLLFGIERQNMNFCRACFSALVVLATANAFQQFPAIQNRVAPTVSSLSAATISPPPALETDKFVDEISAENPLKVLIAGGGVGGLALAKTLSNNPNMEVVVLERTDKFKRFGGPIQLASNALKILDEMDKKVYNEIMEKFTFTGDKENGIKDGIRTEWYAKFDLAGPAEARGMPYTGVIERPDLQEIYLNNLPEGTVQNGDGVVTYTTDATTGRVTAELESGGSITGDVLIGADGIWSAVRSKMHGTPAKGDESGASYSGYTVFAGELNYPSPDNGQVGYKVYIGPQQYFVITDIGNGRYQWYAFLARVPGSVNDPKPEGSSKYLQDLFEGWSSEIHAILTVTQEDEIEQRDLYDRPPSVLKPWTDQHVALLGDGIHAMMPNLGQGGCQAIEDAFVIAEELEGAKTRKEVTGKLESYARRRQIRSAAVQGLSRFASDIIIRGFDTPAKITWEDGKPKFENCNYAGIVTRMLQPILPIFFKVQFNFLYDGWKNEFGIDLVAALSFVTIGGVILLLSAGVVGEAGIAASIGLEAFIGAEGVLDFEAINTFIRELVSMQ
jgi:zeaxanthin epoxidase